MNVDLFSIGIKLFAFNELGSTTAADSQYNDLKREIEIILSDNSRRIQKFKTGDQLMIGINQFENTFETKVKTWGPAPTAFGFPYLIYELV